jgi:hypothetical protein
VGPTQNKSRCPLLLLPEFKRGIVRAFADGFAHKPVTAFGTMNTDVLERTHAVGKGPGRTDHRGMNDSTERWSKHG